AERRLMRPAFAALTEAEHNLIYGERGRPRRLHGDVVGYAMLLQHVDVRCQIAECLADALHVVREAESPKNAAAARITTNQIGVFPPQSRTRADSELDTDKHGENGIPGHLWSVSGAPGTLVTRYDVSSPCPDLRGSKKKDVKMTAITMT